MSEYIGELKSFFRILGFKSVDVKVYLTLLANGPLTAEELSRKSGIPYSKVYSVIRRLESKGIIEKDEGRPYRVYPKPPDVVWNIVKNAINSKIEGFEDKVLPILRNMYVYHRPVISPYKRVGIVEGLDNIISKALEVLVETPPPILIALPFKDMLRPSIVEALKVYSRAKKPKILISPEILEVKELLSLEGAEIRVKRDMFGGGIVGSQVLLLLRYGNSYVGLWSDYDFFIQVARVYFEHLWSNSEEVKRYY